MQLHYNGVLSCNTNLKPNTNPNPNPNPNANPVNVYSIHKNERHNERHSAPPVEWNVEICLLFLPVFVVHGLKVCLTVFVATSYVEKVSEAIVRIMKKHFVLMAMKPWKTSIEGFIGAPEGQTRQGRHNRMCIQGSLCPLWQDMYCRRNWKKVRGKATRT